MGRREDRIRAAKLVKAIGERRWPKASVKRQDASVAALLRWSYGRVRKMRYGRAKIIEAFEMDALRALHKRKL